MPRTCLGMHMLQSVQVFHPLGRKADKTAEPFSSWALGKSRITQNSKTLPSAKPWQGLPHEKKRPESTREHFQSLHSTAETKAPSASLCELLPPGQMKLIALPFPSPEKPQARAVSQRPQPPNSQQHTTAHPVHPTATNTAQPSQTVAGSLSLMGPVKPAQLLKNARPPPWTTSKQPGLPQSAVSKPALWATSAFASLRRESLATAVIRHKALPQPHNPFLLQNFSCQTILEGAQCSPWQRNREQSGKP
ncbi:uncharacterized protein C2orf78 [Fukomys damarensis]|nr:uncharacterized protein C2orf78 [Fukomys damarensis]XP_010630955.1 uncharacterized protein C2orf78 [Fukomys damarensis]